MSPGHRRTAIEEQAFIWGINNMGSSNINKLSTG
ncbi:hypothetical protein SAMN05443144_11741 [Fodinibius roseus]|uniref:Uncharacterized protein n=1 Tax=Fodinibius roseus TaxID=1194090 RepID=A0A1M5GG08_9BACT|nr:hypothetical protein SAMN05443144_11741 [Fodinibius roseus]